MRIALIFLALFPLFVEYTIAGKVFTVHNYRRINVDRNTATVRRLGNTYVFPKYRAASRSSVRRCSYGGYSRECCAGWSRNRDGSCSHCQQSGYGLDAYRFELDEAKMTLVKEWRVEDFPKRGVGVGRQHGYTRIECWNIAICTMNCVHGTCVGPDMCKCDKGYTGKSCNRDLNECGLEPRPCDHRCTNTQGSFKCYCERGYVLLEDKRTCVRDQRCYPGRCSYGCAFKDNKITCVCPPGLRLIEDGYHCKDIDECAEGLVTCPSEQECKNTFGNFLCVCREGYQFQYIDGKYECVGAGCESLGYQCHPDAYCGYIDLRPECICNEGFWGNGQICLPAQIKDCSSQPCFPGVVCTNEYEDIREVSGYPPEGIFEQFKCGECPPGYRGDGIDCEDIDECEEGTHNCDENAECINEPGSFRCECLDGYHGNGEICVLISDLGCDSCFQERDCNEVPLPDPNDVALLSTLDVIYLFECGPCPPGYEGNGTICVDIDECEEGTHNCHENAECINEPGSFRCECLDGYHGNGEICVLISDRGCDSCFRERDCNEVPLPDPNDVALLSTLDVIYLFECGPCPPGYEGNGTICLDINECEIGPPVTDCHVNADCENVPGGFVCMCSDGFFGNGTHCSLLDPRTCDDNPCSPVAQCIPVDEDDLNFLLPVVQLFECGPCPEGYVGDGYNCTLLPPPVKIPDFVNLTVLVIAAEPADGDPILSPAFVRTFVSDPLSDAGTKEHRRGRTADNGMVVVECPHNQSIIVTANDREYFANSVTFRCNLDQTNVVTLPLHKPYEDTIYVYHPESPRAFGVGNETLNERYSTYFPEDSFSIDDGQKVQLLFRSVNVSVTEELELAPEMIACIPRENEQPGRGDVGAPPSRPDDTDIRAIEAYGAVELTVIDQRTSRAPRFKEDKTMVLTFPIQKLPDDLSVGDSVPAWTFKSQTGCWEKDGEGQLVIDEATGNLVWRYEANHFSWWAAGRVNPRTSCVTVRTCYDENCNRVAPDTLIRIFGKDYGFETFRYTNERGQACIQFPYGRTVELSSPCTNDAVEIESTDNPSSCPEGRSEIPKVPDYQMDESQDSCREAVLVIQEYERSCPQPSSSLNNMKLDDTGNKAVYRYTDVVRYSCMDGDNQEILSEGRGNRVCTRCFTWTGNLMCEDKQEVEEGSFFL